MSQRIDEMVEHYIGEDRSKFISDAEIKKEIKKIMKMTDENNHSGAAVAGAELMNKLTNGDYKIKVGAFKNIQKEHERLGHMPAQLGKLRYGMLQSMWKDADKYLDPKMAKMFKGAY